MSGAFVTFKDNGEVGLVVQTEEVKVLEFRQLKVNVHCKKVSLKNVAVSYVPEKESEVDTVITSV